MTPLKQVKTRLVFKTDFPGKVEFLDITSTFNMTDREFRSRDADMLVEDAKGERCRIKKEFIAYIREVKIVEQEVEVVKKKK